MCAQHWTLKVLFARAFPLKKAPCLYEAMFLRMRRINKIVKLWAGKPKQRALQSESAVITFAGLDTGHFLHPYSYWPTVVYSSFSAPSALHRFHASFKSELQKYGI